MDFETALRMAYRAGLNNNNSNCETDEDVVVTGIMDGVTFRRFSIDEWIFDMKMVRALKVQQYGEPYVAAANLTLNGESAYIDTLVGREQSPITRTDIRSISKAAKKLGARNLEYDRINKAGVRSENLALNPF